MSYLGPDAIGESEQLDVKAAIRQVLDPRETRTGVSVIESGPKAGALIALAAYLLGVLTVGIYLRDQDLPAPDLTALKAQYIYTGLEVVLLIAFAGIPALMLLAFWDQRLKLKANLTRRFALAASPFVVVSAALVWGILLYPLSWACDYSFGHTALVCAELVGLGALTCLLVVWAARELIDHGNATSFFLSGFALISVASFASVYSNLVYETLPVQYGGGEPKQARLLFTAESLAGAKDIGVNFKPKSQLSTPMDMLLDGDDFYAVELNNGQTAQILKSTVVGLQEDTRPPFAVKVATVNNGALPGFPEAGDQLILTFSEKMDSSSFVDDWTGADPIRKSIMVAKGDKGAMLTFRNRAGTKDLPAFGTITFGSEKPRALFGSDPFPVSISRDQERLIITLRAHAGAHPGRISLEGIAWDASTEATDTKGNEALKSTATNSDLDF